MRPGVGGIGVIAYRRPTRNRYRLLGEYILHAALAVRYLAHAATSQRMEVPMGDICAHCEGNGEIYEGVRCMFCLGTGEVQAKESMFDAPEAAEMTEEDEP